MFEGWLAMVKTDNYFWLPLFDRVHCETLGNDNALNVNSRKPNRTNVGTLTAEEKNEP